MMRGVWYGLIITGQVALDIVGVIAFERGNSSIGWGAVLGCLVLLVVIIRGANRPEAPKSLKFEPRASVAGGSSAGIRPEIPQASASEEADRRMTAELDALIGSGIPSEEVKRRMREIWQASGVSHVSPQTETDALEIEFGVVALPPSPVVEWMDPSKSRPSAADAGLMIACLDGLIASGMDRDEAVLRSVSVYRQVRLRLPGASADVLERLNQAENAVEMWQAQALMARAERDGLRNLTSIEIPAQSRETIEMVREVMQTNRGELGLIVAEDATTAAARALAGRVTPEMLAMPIPTEARAVLEELVLLGEGVAP